MVSGAFVAHCLTLSQNDSHIRRERVKTQTVLDVHKCNNVQTHMMCINLTSKHTYILVMHNG